MLTVPLSAPTLFHSFFLLPVHQMCFAPLLIYLFSLDHPPTLAHLCYNPSHGVKAPLFKLSLCSLMHFSLHSLHSFWYVNSFVFPFYSFSINGLNECTSYDLLFLLCANSVKMPDSWFIYGRSTKAQTSMKS